MTSHAYLAYADWPDPRAVAIATFLRPLYPLPSLLCKGTECFSLALFRDVRIVRLYWCLKLSPLVGISTSFSLALSLSRVRTLRFLDGVRCVHQSGVSRDSWDFPFPRCVWDHDVRSPAVFAALTSPTNLRRSMPLCLAQRFHAQSPLFSPNHLPLGFATAKDLRNAHTTSSIPEREPRR